MTTQTAKVRFAKAVQADLVRQSENVFTMHSQINYMFPGKDEDAGLLRALTDIQTAIIAANKAAGKLHRTTK